MFYPFTTTWETLLGLQDALDRTMHSDGLGSNISGRGVFPPVNMFEEEGDLMLVAELPGVRKEDLRLEIENNQLRFKGERHIEHGNEVSIHRAERRPGGFDRTLKLPFNVEAEKIKAEYQNGLLVLRMPRAEAERPRQINIA